MVRLTRRKLATVQQAIASWEAAGTLSRELAERLRASLTLQPFDWRRLARYAFMLAMACIVIALGALLADEALMALLQWIFDFPAGVKSLLLLAMAGGTYVAGSRFAHRYPARIYSLNFIYFGAMLCVAGSVTCLGVALDTGPADFPLLVLLASAVYLGVGMALRSAFSWAVGLVGLATYFGSYTGYLSGWGAYWFGMNYPLRFVLFSSALIGLALLFRGLRYFEPFHRVTLGTGLFYLFMALWILSIFGNYGQWSAWQGVKQYELLHWSLAFGLAAGLAILYGLRFDDGMARGFGITFLMINLYTRFFESFWDHLHKGVFFLLLGMSFWLLGRKAETIWSLGRRRAA